MSLRTVLAIFVEDCLIFGFLFCGKCVFDMFMLV